MPHAVQGTLFFGLFCLSHFFFAIITLRICPSFFVCFAHFFVMITLLIFASSFVYKDLSVGDVHVVELQETTKTQSAVFVRNYDILLDYSIPSRVRLARSALRELI